ncbi:MAG: AAA family ATPase [Armatimonadetes bacterium]|nr:AAA family ATPase [Armatimonadota bacterium]MDW8120749.1 AAA family ATPase [Armatimonadota bacterium]
MKPLAESEIKELESVARIGAVRKVITDELSKVIVGQATVIEHLMIALLARGHCLLIGVPGLAKTLLVSSLARVLDLSFRRIQFTPDLMPSDIMGADVLQEDPDTGRRRFEFSPGPIFANIILADEINRAPPKTQSALLEAMQEGRVTVGGHTYPLPQPFFVLATQNPIEMEGTYPLPEAQLDRFLFSVVMDYPTEEEEEEIVQLTTSAYTPELAVVMGRDEFMEAQSLVRRVPVPDRVAKYAVELVRRSRPQDKGALDFIRQWVQWGAGPRASQSLILAAKARALLHGRTTPTCADVRALANPVLRHRLVLNFAAEAEGLTTDQIVEQLVQSVPEP